MDRLGIGAALAALLLTGCSAGGSESMSRPEFEKVVNDGVHPDDPSAKVSTRCEGGIEKTDGATQDCVITVGPDHSSVHVTLREHGDTFDVDYQPYITATDLEDALRSSLTQHGVSAGSLACPGDLDGTTGERLECDVIAGGEPATVAVRVTEVDGLKVNFHYEVH